MGGVRAFLRFFRRQPAIAPMTMREAFEVMKIVAPHSAGLSLSRDNIAMLRVLIDRVGDANPRDVLSLVALMEHRSLESVAEDYQKKPNPVDFLLRVLAGFARNPIDLLVNGAYHLGLTEEVWRG